MELQHRSQEGHPVTTALSPAGIPSGAEAGEPREKSCFRNMSLGVASEKVPWIPPDSRRMKTPRD